VREEKGCDDPNSSVIQDDKEVDWGENDGLERVKVKTRTQIPLTGKEK